MEACWFRVIHPPINTYFTSRNVSVLSGHILLKIATNIHHVSGYCWKGFQGQRSEAKVMTRPVNLWCRRHTLQQCGVEADVFVFWYLFPTLVLYYSSSSSGCSMSVECLSCVENYQFDDTLKYVRLFAVQIHDIESADYGPLKRVQGIAIPRQLPVCMLFVSASVYLFQ